MEPERPFLYSQGPATGSHAEAGEFGPHREILFLQDTF
jgi:hypothetical protein